MSLVWHPQGLLSVHRTPPMFGTGFVDYAGGGVLHLVSGAASFVAALAVGPRLDEKGQPRFRCVAHGRLTNQPKSKDLQFLHLPATHCSNGGARSALANPLDFEGTSPIFTCLGFMWILSSWFGFLHGGSLLPGQVMSAASIATSASNVILASSFGAMSYVIEYFLHHQQFNFQRFFNRALAALVATNGFSGCAFCLPLLLHTFL
jgi:ammonia channel protein AmtB